MQDRFTSRDVVALTATTARRLPWSDVRGVVPPERKRHRRLCTPQHLSRSGAVICQSRRKGFSLNGMWKVTGFSDRELGQRLAEIVGGSCAYHRLTDGTHLYLVSSVSRALGGGDRGYPEEFEPADSAPLSDPVRQVRGRDCLRKGEYFGNVA